MTLPLSGPKYSLERSLTDRWADRIMWGAERWGEAGFQIHDPNWLPKSTSLSLREGTSTAGGDNKIRVSGKEGKKGMEVVSGRD